MDILKEFWAIIMAAVAYVAWLVRLESKANTNTKEMEKLEKRLERQRIEDLERHRADRAEDLEYNRTHREDVKATLKSIQEDIKLLLQRRE